MLTLPLAFAFACFGAGFLMTLARLLIGPALPDRVLAVDTMVVNAIALIVLYGIKTGMGLNFPAAMLLAMTGFVSTIAFCKFLLRGSVIE
ncbi:K+/H+ antiporter subunit F [Paragemmobacter straminiformis]|uniref:K+/H+ antiporter subunit F n=1 Tax=Paragemmobacter straminiformis TaxID=2045119 RepID=A0A842IBJ5_9RHOB|nr:K+/H+ antiporter subunit F [Gemmobacter straminiformis]